MISFKSRCEAIRNADKITLAAKSLYPHVSGTKSGVMIDSQIKKSLNTNLSCRLSFLNAKITSKIENMREKDRFGLSLYRNIVDRLKNNGVGNCYEEAFLCELIGKINGFKNIYPAKIFFTRNSSGMKLPLDHVVTVISDKPLDKEVMYEFKNKEAVILDPWLGITEFAQNYFTRLKNNFSKYFFLLPDDRFNMQKLKSETKTPYEFHQARRRCFKPDFSLLVHDEDTLNDDYVEILKREFPELVINNKK